MTAKLKLILPFVILFALLALLARELFFSTPLEMPSTLIGQPLPSFQLPTIAAKTSTLSEKVFRKHVTLFNVWATWCPACLSEAPMLMKIKNQYHVPIYSIVYKDDKAAVTQWLQANGNPYIAIGDDQQGDVAIDLGVYGTPETFVINQDGRIVYRHVGPITQTAWDNVLYPLIQKIEHPA